MKSFFLNYLQEYVCEDKLELYNRADQVLEQLDYTAAYVAADSLLAERQTTMTSTESIDAMTSIIETSMDNLLFNFTIKTIGATLAQKLFLLETLIQIDDFEDVDYLIELCNTEHYENDRVDQLVDILAFVSGVDADSFLDIIADVEDCLIDRIRDMATAAEGMRVEILAPPIGGPKREMLLKFVSKYRFTFVEKGIQEGLRLNIPSRFLFNQYKMELQALEPMAPKQAVIEVVGLLVLSDTPVDKIRARAINLAGQIFSQESFKTAFGSLLSTVMSEVQING